MAESAFQGPEITPALWPNQPLTTHRLQQLLVRLRHSYTLSIRRGEAARVPTLLWNMGIHSWFFTCSFAGAHLNISVAG